jgi:hypothetical protein
MTVPANLEEIRYGTLMKEVPVPYIFVRKKHTYKIEGMHDMIQEVFRGCPLKAVTEV